MNSIEVKKNSIIDTYFGAQETLTKTDEVLKESITFVLEDKWVAKQQGLRRHIDEGRKGNQ